MIGSGTNRHQTFSAWCGQMLVKDRSLVFRYSIAFAAVALASFLVSLFPSRVDPSHFTLFFLAVMLSAWYGGFGAGLMATILSALSLDYFFISPLNSIDLDSHAFVRLCVFLIVAGVTNFLTSARRRAEEALRKAHGDLEDRVRARTAELARANEALREEIVERKRMEQELFRLQHEIGRVERLATLGRMTGIIAHDLGTPLNSVLGYTQLLSQENLSERARRRVAIIETQINRMSDIIRRYLVHTRGSPPRNKVSINDLIRDTLLLLQPVFQQRDVKVSPSLASTIPILYADSNSIQRMLINLLDNAVDACDKGGVVKIRTIESPATRKKGSGIIIEIADNGSGIPAEILPKIFDLFVTTKAPGKGTGLGLVICQEIIKAHGGTVNVTSQVGQGTTVTVYLPVDDRPEPSQVVEQSNERAHIDC